MLPPIPGGIPIDCLVVVVVVEIIISNGISMYD